MLNPVSEPLIDTLLPALRSVVADDLQSRGYSQTEIAEMMDITQPAVSQYLSRERGKGIELIRKNVELQEKASMIASRIAQGDQEGVRRHYLQFCHTVLERDDFEELLDYDRHFFMDLAED